MTLQIDENIPGAVKVEDAHAEVAKSVRQRTLAIQEAAKAKIQELIAEASQACENLAVEGRADWLILREKLGLGDDDSVGLHLDERTGYVITTGDLKAHLIKTETGVNGEDLSGNDSDEVAQRVHEHLLQIGANEEAIASTGSLSKADPALANGTAPVADAPAVEIAPAEGQDDQEPTSAGQAPATEAEEKANDGDTVH